MKELFTRRDILRLAAVGVATLFTVACEGGKIENETITNTVTLTGMPLIPIEFGTKKLEDLVSSELAPRTELSKWNQVGRLSSGTDHRRYNSAYFSFVSPEGTISIRNNSYIGDSSLLIKVVEPTTLNTYEVNTAQPRARVISGESASQQRADAIMKGLPEFLIKNFNDAIRAGAPVNTSYSFDHWVPATPTPTK